MSRKFDKNTKKISPAFLPVLALLLAVLLYPVCRWLGAVFTPALGRALLLVLTVLGASTVMSYMMSTGALRSVLHGIGEFFYPLFLTALPLLLAADAVFYLGVEVEPRRALLILAAVFVPMAAAGLYEGLGLKVRRYTARIPGAEPCRLVLVSDLHLGFFTPGSLTEALTDAVLRERPDAVILAGDMFDDRFESIPERRREKIAAGLKRLSSAVPVYGCEGNHDLLTDDPRKDAFLAGCGIKMLYDEAVTEHGIRFVFRRDVKNGARADADTVYPDDGSPCVTVDHNPSAHREAWAHGAALVLSGHTHGGQTFPGSLIYKIRRVRGYGFIREGEKQLAVTAGAGIYGCPIRLGAAREIAVIECVSDGR